MSIEEGPGVTDELLLLETLLCIWFVGIFMLLGSYLPKWNIIYFHESGVCIVIGLLTGFLIKEFIGELSKFDAHLFFNFMLPFLILGAGYNMKRRRFFKNIGPILMLGVAGTLIAFIVIGLFCYIWSEAGLIYDKHGKQVHITLQEALLVGSTLSATDVVCTLALVKEQKTPRLHSILFGESASNDAIAILLLASLNNVNISEISASSVFQFLGEFVYNCVTSTLLGIIFGALSAYITKRFRSLRDWPSRETAMLLYIAWIGYVIAELLDISGVICILVCAIVSGHYAMYNLSPAARVVSHNFFHFVGDASEALVFAYLGLTAYSYDLFSVPLLFLTAMFFSTMIARFCGTFILSYFCTLITWGKHNLGPKNLSIIWLGGVARGGVSFALVLTITGSNSEVLQSSVLALVIVGTLVFGTVLPLWILLMDVKESAGSVVEADGAHGGGHGEGHEEIVPVEEVKQKGWFHRKWRHIDDHYIKKWLIHEDELREQRRIRESMARHRDMAEADPDITEDDRIIQDR